MCSTPSAPTQSSSASWTCRRRRRGERFWKRWAIASSGSGRGSVFDPALSPDVFVEPVDGPLPREIGGGFVVPLRRRVAVEAVHRAGIDVAVVRHVGGLQRGI